MTSSSSCLSVPCRLGTPAYRLQDKTRNMACIHALSHAVQLWTLPPYKDRLRRCHMPYGSGPRFPAEVDSGAATCPSALDHASRPRWAPVLPRAPQVRTSLPCWEGLWHLRVSYDSGPRLPVGHATRLTCFQGKLACYQGACKMCRHVASS
jgi:hypothetical protein